MCKLAYEIWQVKDIMATKYAFRSWKEAEELFNPLDYKLVYKGEEEDCDDDSDIDLLEYLFMKFNMNHPKDFKGHSLSVSDVVRIYNSDGMVTTYYCNDIGWKKIDY